ncbi:MAG: hypothetical protein FWF10_06260 [Clostridiales bacterium]|nr:hypothetical protein [Clostridiales bacterium]
MMHKLIHVLIYGNVIAGWEQEGIAGYLSLAYMQAFYFPNFTEDEYMLWTDALDDMKDYYASVQSLPNTAEELDVFLFYEAIARITLEWHDCRWQMIEELKAPLWWIYNRTRVYQLQIDFEGDKLTHPETFLLAKYLIDSHGGLDNFIDFCLGGKSMEECFGMSYKEAMAQMMEDLGLKIEWE